MIGILIFVISELLFLKVPVEISYLLPLLFVATPLTIAVFRPRRVEIYGFIFLTILYGFVINLDILNRRYNEAGTEAIAADLGVFVRPGVVIADLCDRKNSERKYFAEYNLKREGYTPYPVGLDSEGSRSRNAREK